MSQITRLLLSKGGGIIAEKQQSEQIEGATLVIGLGGTGVDCLANLKQKVYDRLKPDDPAAAVPGYERIKFLAVDSDPDKVKDPAARTTNPWDLRKDTEFFDISNKQFVDFGSPLYRDRPDLNTWMRDDLPRMDTTPGAGGVRQAGRFLIMARSSDFVDKIRELIKQARVDRDDDASISIHVFSGISGGTGAGTFLDVCYLVRKAFAMSGITAKATIDGYFFMPDVNLERGDPGYLERNGYAALKELDYCMGFGNGRPGEWRQHYEGFGDLVFRKAPVDYCHLITAQTAGGAIKGNAYDYALNVTTEYVMEFLVYSRPMTLPDGTVFVMDLSSHRSNIDQTVTAQNIKPRGANYVYLIIGAASARIPYKEILTYLAARLLESFAPLKDRKPSDKDVEGFLSEVLGSAGRHVETIKNRLKKRSGQADFTLDINPTGFDNEEMRSIHAANRGYTPDVDRAAIQQSSITGPEKLLRSFDKKLNACLGCLEANKEELGQGLDRYYGQAQQGAGSLANVTFKRTEDLLCNPAYGPFYVDILLGGGGVKNLGNVITGCVKEVESRRATLSGDFGLRIDEYETARDRFHDRRPAKRKLFNEYVEATQNLYVNWLEQEICGYIIKTLKGYKERVEEIQKAYTERFCTTLNSILETFKDNLTAINTHTNPTSPFIEDLIDLDDPLLQANIDATLEAMDTNHEIELFVGLLWSQRDAWLARQGVDSEIQIAQLTRGHFAGFYDEDGNLVTPGRFMTHADKTIDGYLMTKYNTNNATTVAQKVDSQIVRPLLKKADPLFWATGDYAGLGIKSIGYCTIPDGSAVMPPAANSLKAANPWLEVRPAELPDRVSILRVQVGIPLYAYQGLRNYEEKYRGDTAKGKHLHEGITLPDGGTGKDWRELPSPRPYTLLDSRDPHDKALLDGEGSIESEYEEVLARDIIVQVGTDWYLQTLDDAFVERLDALIAEARSSSNSLAERNMAVQKARGDWQGRQARTVRGPDIPDYGTPTDNAALQHYRKDSYIGSPELAEIGRRELERYRRFEKELERLADWLAEQAQEGSRRQAFFDALFAGVIAISSLAGNKLRLSCTLNDEERLLTEYGKEMDAVPPYQAYLSFAGFESDKALRGLDDEDREALQEATNAAFNAVDNPAVEAALATAKQVFTAKQKDNWSQAAGAYAVDEYRGSALAYERIAEFLDALYAAKDLALG
jgi:hypothetical protein